MLSESRLSLLCDAAHIASVACGATVMIATLVTALLGAVLEPLVKRGNYAVIGKIGRNQE